MKIISFIAKLVLTHLSIIHKGTVFSQLKSSVVIGLLISPFTYIPKGFIEWCAINKMYFTLVIIALFADLVMGVYVHLFKFKDFTLKKMVTGFLSKFFLTVLGLILFEVFKAVFAENNIEIGDYFKLTIALIVVSYPLFSAFGNLSEATNGKFPPIGWMNKIKKFQENLNASDLTKN